MTEADRLTRNLTMLTQTHPAFRARVDAVVQELEQSGWRPRLQAAWRSPTDQLVAFQTGHSKLRWGYHNATSRTGAPEALAVDLVDDDHPLNPTMTFIIAVSHVARAQGLNTGVDWALPANIRKALNQTIAVNGAWDGKIGWDPLHIEWVGISVAAARAGARPSSPSTSPEVPV